MNLGYKIKDNGCEILIKKITKRGKSKKYNQLEEIKMKIRQIEHEGGE
jgi:hypothetical protein